MPPRCTPQATRYFVWCLKRNIAFAYKFVPRNYIACRNVRHVAGVHEPSTHAGCYKSQMDTLDAGRSTQEIFRCQGIDGVALQFRRRVQFGLALEFIGTQSCNFLFHDGLQLVSLFSDANNCLLMLHIFVVWKYHEMMRDSLLARHVTRIAIVLPSEQTSALVLLGGAPHDNQIDTQSTITNPSTATTPLVAIVETGPWKRRLELKVPLHSSGEGCSHSDQSLLRLGDLIRFGALNVDQVRGDVLNRACFRHVVSKDFQIVHEDLHFDQSIVERACVNHDAISPSLLAIDPEFIQWVAERPMLHGPLQWPGGHVMHVLGVGALLMGAGTICIWLPVSGDFSRAAQFAQGRQQRSEQRSHH